MHPILAALQQAAKEHPSYSEEFTNGIIDWMNRAQAILDAAGGSQHFEAFWKLYPRKVSKQASYAAWRRMEGDKHAEAIMANIRLRLRVKDWETTPDRVRFIPHATTFLNQRRWLDVPDTGGPGKRGGDNNPMMTFVPRAGEWIG